MPLLLEALDELAKAKYLFKLFVYYYRPENPIEFIAKYMLEHNPE